jgi:hypothetical protein
MNACCVELLHFSHFHHVSLVQWTNRLLPATGGSSLCPRGATHTLELELPVSAASLQSRGVTHTLELGLSVSNVLLHRSLYSVVVINPPEN